MMIIQAPPNKLIRHTQATVNLDLDQSLQKSPESVFHREIDKEQIQSQI